MNLATRFKLARKEMGISQTQLAARIGCAQSLVAKIERGGADRSKYMTEFAVELGVSPDWLATGRGEHKYSETRESQRYSLRDDPSDQAWGSIKTIEMFLEQARQGNIPADDVQFVANLLKMLLNREN